MNVKEIAQKAVLHVADLFESEGITNVGLEEVTFDEGADELQLVEGVFHDTTPSFVQSVD